MNKHCFLKRYTLYLQNTNPIRVTTYTQEFKDYSLDLVEKSLKLVDNIDETPFRKDLLENIQNLFSASKMEGQIDIVIYSEYLLNFCSALVKGGIVTNSKVIAGIKECLEELKTKIHKMLFYVIK